MLRTPEHNAKIAASLAARGVGASPTKFCPRCKRTLPRSEFGQRIKAGRPFVQSYCRPCHKADGTERARRHRDKTPHLKAHRSAQNYRTCLKARYGLTVADYEALLLAQDGCCAICRHKSERTRLHVDHDHRTNRVRGILCARCNSAIGLFVDNIDTLRAAIAYLARPRP